jgi:hypothetical protein
MSTSVQRPPSRFGRAVTLRRVAISIVVSACLVGVGYGFSRASDAPSRPTVLVSRVEAVIPPNGDLELRQGLVGLDLAPGFDAAIQIDGREIPEDQIRRVVGLNQLFYSPGPGTETGPLAPGRHVATAVVWPLGQTRETAGSNIRWEFNAH